MKDISITIVLYKNYKCVYEAVKSIEEFTSKDITKQIYLVDNSCVADDDKVKQKFLKRISAWDDIEYIDTKANLGFGKGHNYIMDRLDSRFHAIVNPDVLLVEDSFPKIMEYMSDETIGMCVPKLVDEKGERLEVYRREVTLWDMFVRIIFKFCKKRYNYHIMADCDFSKELQIPFAQGSFLVIRTELYKELGGFDDRFFMYMEDADLCKRVNDCSRLMYYPGTQVIHKWEKGSHYNLKLTKIHIVSLFKYMRKWGWKLI